MFGKLLGKKSSTYNTAGSKSGLFAVNEQMVLLSSSQWSAVFIEITDRAKKDLKERIDLLRLSSEYEAQATAEEIAIVDAWYISATE